MDFKESRKQYNKKQRIKFNSKMKFLGGGGSSNLIYIADKFVYKIIPYFKKEASDIKRFDNDQKEMNVYKILTKEFILTNRTPHIVGYYDHYKMKLPTVFGICPSMEEKYFKKDPFKNMSIRVCRLKDRIDKGKIKETADVIVIEKSPNDISKTISELLKTNKTNKFIELGKLIDRISFQTIFTLAVILDKYPTFVHNDFFLRNILGTMENKYEMNEYVEYNFKGKKFYLPANGFYIKINDFGYTLAKSKMISTMIFAIDRSIIGMPKIDCNKCDVFNFLHDFYDGQNLDAKSVMTIMKKKSEKNKKYIRNIFKKYIDVKIIDKINKVNRSTLNSTWAIKEVNLLKKTVKTPKQYLNGTTFKKYKKLPKNGVVVKKYGI